MNDRFSKIIAYKGSSMKPFLKTSDILYVSHYKGNTIRCGDIIAFYPPDSNDIIIHVRSK